MIQVRRIAHAGFETPDIEKLAEYYETVLGLAVAERERNAVYLGGPLDHHSVVLRKGDAARCTRLAFNLAPDSDLGLSARELDKHGVKSVRRADAEPSIPDMLSFADPKGTEIVVYAASEPTARVSEAKGISPHKLGHVAFNVTDLGKIVDFYVDVLGFRESDWMGDFFAFLRCGPDHHTVNFLDGKSDKMHHIAFELRDWAHVESACDFLAQHQIPLIWGPGRHGIGHNIFTYHRNGDGQIVELFTEIDRMHDENLGYFEPRPWHSDRPQKPKTWVPSPSAANLWGVLPPSDFLD